MGTKAARDERSGDHEPHDLDDMLDAACDAGDGHGTVSLGDILDTVGHRSFGPLLLVLALIALTPLGGIPGLPTVLAAVVVVIAGQLVMGIEHFWLPGFVLRRKISSGKLRASVRYLRPVARGVDKVIRPRLSWLLKGPFIRLAAFGCILVALTVPPLEVVPFAGAVSWAAIAAFGLAVIARDGLLILLALAFAVGTAGLLAWSFL